MNVESESILLRRMEFYHQYDIEVWLRKEVSSFSIYGYSYLHPCFIIPKLTCDCILHLILSYFELITFSSCPGNWEWTDRYCFGFEGCIVKLSGVFLLLQALSLDTDKKTVTFDDGSVQSYDQLLISTGCRYRQIHTQLTKCIIYAWKKQQQLNETTI